jgi:ubiquinone/menaquinone biosynthesis C-methylase UbiE
MDPRIRHNRRAHDAIAEAYEERHGEIFNPIEQERLRQNLRRALQLVQTHSPRLQVLDYGCGSGNLTKHLLDLGLHVTAADVSKKFLRMARERYRGSGALETMLLNGQDLHGIPDHTLDMVAAYSVLHHVPDYLRIVREMARVLKPGGVLYLDHEHAPAYWEPSETYQQFIGRAVPPRVKTWRRFLVWKNYIFHLRRLFNPRYEPEGDIHVWPDDHIEWDRIKAVVEEGECTVVVEEDYLLYRSGYPLDLYREYATRCADMRLMIARKG